MNCTLESFSLLSRIARCIAVACTTCSRRVVAGRAITLSETFVCFNTLPLAMLPDRFTELLFGTFGHCWLGLLCIRFFNLVWLCCHNILDVNTDGALLFREHPPLIDTYFVRASCHGTPRSARSWDSSESIPPTLSRLFRTPRPHSSPHCVQSLASRSLIRRHLALEVRSPFEDTHQCLRHQWTSSAR